MKDYSHHHKNDKNDKKEKPIEFIMNTLKILQNKNPIPEGFSKNEMYKYPFEILNNLSKEEKQSTLKQIRNEYNKYFSEEYEIAKQFWNSMNYISFFLCNESKKSLLKDDEIMSLLDNYKSEEEMSQIESEIKKNMNSGTEDAQFWRNLYELLNYLKHKKLMEDLYNNFINNQRINHKLEIIDEKENEEDEENDDEENKNKEKKNIKLKREDFGDDYINYVDEVDNVDNIDIDELDNNKKENNKKKNKKEISLEERYNILNRDLEKIRYNRFLNEDSDDDENNNNDDEKTEEDLSPQKYDSDEELSKVAINQMDYFANLNANRKKILGIKVNEYKENKKNENLESKNKKKIKNKDKNNENKINTKNNIINLDEEDNDDNDKDNNNKNKQNSFLDFIMNQKNANLKKKIEESDNDDENGKNKKDENEDKESDQEALDFLQKISGHKKHKKNILDVYGQDFSSINKKETKDEKDKDKENPEENNQLSEFQKTIQNFDKYLDKNDISGVYTNFEIIENTFRDLEKNTDNELVFNDIVEVKKEYEWSKEYKPIKPRYSNKKIIGFDWNRYNQAHYDNDNLPPKAVTGYRFNIFYPNLVDKTKTPRFYLQRSETPDMCIIRFESGAPYEDVAFKIINREWNTRVKGDFLNIFDKGVLKLYFKFKRFRYKR